MLSCEGLLLVVTQASQCLWLADRLGWRYPVKDCCWLWPRRVNVCCWLIVWVDVILWRNVVGCDTGESIFVVGWSFGLMLSCEGLLLVVTQASQCLWLADRLGWCYPAWGLLLVVTQASQCLANRLGWCYPVKDCCWLRHRRVNVCGWLIVWVDVILWRTVVGCDPGESILLLADRLGWCYPVKDCCWLWPRRVNVCG